MSVTQPTDTTPSPSASEPDCTCEDYWHNPTDHDAKCPISKAMNSPTASERAERLLEPAVESLVHTVNSVRYRGELGTGPMRDSYRWPLSWHDHEAIGKVALDFVVKYLPELQDRITSEITAAEEAARREALNDAIDVIENHPRDFVGGELMTTSEFEAAVITTLKDLLPPSKETV